MGYLTDLKTNKDKQKELLDKLGSMPKLVKFIASTVSFSARLVAPLSFLYNCTLHKYKARTISLSEFERDELRLKRDTYMDLMKNVSDSFGFIEYDNCDSLLFTGLVGAVGFRTLITQAQNFDGSWERRSIGSVRCYPDHSASSISRDMLLGLLWYIWRNKRLDLAQELWNYGVSHRWIMGEGEISRIYLTPALQATLAEIIYRLGGANRIIARNQPQTYSIGLEGYEAHLEVLHILLRGELMGYITTPMRSTLSDLCSRYIDNHLFTLAKARYAPDQGTANILGEIATFGLEDVSLWPKDRLPSDEDRSSRWIFENNDTSKGTDKTITHSGGDLVFCASLVLDYSI